MLADATLPVPASLMTLLAGLAPLFTAPSFRTFCGLACGFLTQTGKRTVCGMLAGAGLSRLWPHDRAHRFFSRARWSPDELGLAVARLVVALLLPAGEPVVVAVDDTLFRRRGKKVWAASWFHDGSAAGPAKTGYGNNWVVAAVSCGCRPSAECVRFFVRGPFPCPDLSCLRRHSGLALSDCVLSCSAALAW